MAEYVESGLRKIGITLSKPVLATICILSGILVILMPTLLVWIVGLFLMLQGTLLWMDLYEMERIRTTVAPEGIYCSSCGTNNIKEATYCWKCGKELDLVKQRDIKDHKETTVAVPA